jgi:signal transduction histidine kinase/DNA-binding NarL/FixJ family response regulator
MSFNESQRIKALYSYQILDTHREEEYDLMTKLAATICGTSMSSISLVDKERVWCKSVVGPCGPEAPRDLTICDRATRQNDFYEILDASQDNFFRNNPYVCGEPFVRFYAAMPLTTPSGHNLGVLCVFDTKPRQALTEVQRLTIITLAKQVMINFELRLKNMELEKLSRAKDDFLSNMSHEIRTPMNAICGFTDLLLQTSLNTEQSDMLRIVKSSVDILITIINDILDYSKIESGKLTFENTPFNLKMLINSVYQLLKVKSTEKGINFNIGNLDNIPEYIKGDKVRLSQILTNLIGNAIKFTDKGSVSIITDLIELNNDACILQFSVVDTGIGISEDKLRKIFERFEQAESDTTVKYGGTGLGLSISKSLVELQGGLIEVLSQIGNGSTFRFMIKFELPNEKEKNELIKLTNDNKFIKPDLSNMRILLVEDVEMNRKLILKVLEGTNCTIDIAENGKVCISKIGASTYDLVLMDLHMPEMDGYEATDFIRRHMKLNVPIIAITASACSKEKDKCIIIGMNDYMTKPFKFEEFYTHVSRYTTKQVDYEMLNTASTSSDSSIATNQSTASDNVNMTCDFVNLPPDPCSKKEKKSATSVRKKVNKMNLDKYTSSKRSRLRRSIYKDGSNSPMSNSPSQGVQAITNSQPYHESTNLNSLNEYADNDDELITGLIDQYQSDFPGYLTNLLSNIESNNFNGVKEIAHKMKCPITIFGMEKTKDVLVEMENLALSIVGNIERLKERYQICKTNIEKSFVDLKFLKH